MLLIPEINSVVEESKKALEELAGRRRSPRLFSTPLADLFGMYKRMTAAQRVYCEVEGGLLVKIWVVNHLMATLPPHAVTQHSLSVSTSISGGSSLFFSCLPNQQLRAAYVEYYVKSLNIRLEGLNDTASALVFLGMVHSARGTEGTLSWLTTGFALASSEVTHVSYSAVAR